MTCVLVLRPEPGATATAARAAASGFRAVKAPLFEVRPVAWSPPDPPPDAVMATSANALRHAGPALHSLVGLPLWAVGEATAAEGRAKGFTAVTVIGPDAAALVAAIPPGLRVLHLAGREHRAPLPPCGERRIVYAAEPVELLPQVARGPLDAGAVALLHSPRAARLFGRLVAVRERVAIACLSAAVAEAAGLGWKGVAVAAEPTDAALLRAIGGAAECR